MNRGGSSLGNLDGERCGQLKDESKQKGEMKEEDNDVVSPGKKRAKTWMERRFTSTVYMFKQT